MTDIEIQDLGPLHLAGLSQVTSHAATASPVIWRSFAPSIREIESRADQFRYNVRQYPEALTLDELTPDTEYTQWAAVALTNGDAAVPDPIEKLRLPGGTYAHYTYRGAPDGFGTYLERLLREWLPGSGYDIDNSRPHFERLGPDYRPDDPEATEEVFLPVVLRHPGEEFTEPEAAV